MLTDDDFAIVPRYQNWRTDMINEAAWASIVRLPDDVAVRTSSYHGGTLAQLSDLWGAWVECFGEERDCLFPVMLDAGDDFMAATYNTLTGFYRYAIAGIRSALELVTIGTWAQMCGQEDQFARWRGREIEVSFGKACDGLYGATMELRRHLQDVAGDSLFDQKSRDDDGGFLRRTYAGISDFAHSRPGFTDGDMRNSNGPIYHPGVFNHVAWIQFEAMGLCFVLLLLARPKARLPQAAIDLFNDVKRVKSRVTRAAFLRLREWNAGS